MAKLSVAEKSSRATSRIIDLAVALTREDTRWLISLLAEREVTEDKLRAARPATPAGGAK